MKVSGKMKVEFYMSEYEGENAFLILGAWSRAAKKQGFSQEEINTVLQDAQSSDYEHLCKVIMEHSY